MISLFIRSSLSTSSFGKEFYPVWGPRTPRPPPSEIVTTSLASVYQNIGPWIAGFSIFTIWQTL